MYCSKSVTLLSN